jgi:uncharacterized membrane protein YedE/YeeE
MLGERVEAIAMRSEPERHSAVGPLPRRVTDRVEDAVAWVVMAAGLLLVMAAAVTGIAVHGGESARADLESRSRSQVRAVLVEEAWLRAGDLGERLPIRALARWSGPDGREHTGTVDVGGVARAGTEVAVWVDAAGVAVSRPVRPVNAVVGGITAGFGVLCAGGTLLGAMWFAVRGLTGRSNARRWGREWEQAEPGWRRHLL